MQPILTTIAVTIGVAIALCTALVLTRATSPIQVRRTLGVGLISAGVVLLYLRAFALAVLILFIGTGLVLRKGTSKATTGRASKVSSLHLEMTLDHDSGDMDGLILSGAFGGCLLSDLGLAALFQFASEIKDDVESVKLLETYLDRAHSGWRESADANTNRTKGASPSGRISRDEAYRVLGLEPGASVDDIREAYRRLIKRVHPDRGGSAALAAQINEAKDLLLDGH